MDSLPKCLNFAQFLSVTRAGCWIRNSLVLDQPNQALKNLALVLTRYCLGAPVPVKWSYVSKNAFPILCAAGFGTYVGSEKKNIQDEYP